MRHEKPQAGNPNQLTINQHVLPRASIERFENADGLVEVCRIGSVFSVGPDDAVFSARRVWDQGAEEAYLSTEASFQSLAETIAKDPSHVLSSDENGLASRFFSLVCARTLARRNPIPDQPLQAAGPLSTFDKDLFEKLEKLGYVTLSPTGQIPGRMVVGPRLHHQIGLCEAELSGQEWLVAQSESVDFLVSDSIDRVPVIPITPRIVLCLDKGGVLTEEEVRRHNELVRTEHDVYYFAMDLTKC